MSEDRQERVTAYAEELTAVIGHADRAEPLRDIPRNASASLAMVKPPLMSPRPRAGPGYLARHACQPMPRPNHRESSPSNAMLNTSDRQRSKPRAGCRRS